MLKRLLIGKCLVLTGLSTSLLGLEHSRSSTEISLTIESQSFGEWKLVTEDGKHCHSGKLSPGQNNIHLEKVASDENLRILKRSRGSTRYENLGVMKAQHNFSKLKKPDGTATIYQLPVRTYFATGTTSSSTGRLTSLTDEFLGHIKDLNIDYLWLTGVLEHAASTNTDRDGIKGNAGSFYGVYDSWDVASDVGSITDLEEAIQRAHAKGIRVLIDFIPNHTARIHRTDVLCKQDLEFGQKDDKSTFFSPSNNYFYLPGQAFEPPYQPNAPGADGIYDQDIFTPEVQLEYPARVTGNDVVSANPSLNDWMDTIKLNYGYDFSSQAGFYGSTPRTWNQMLDIAKYWVSKGVDGFRIDFAHAVPIEFFEYWTSELRKINSELFFIAEAYENDTAMRVPGFSYERLMNAGVNSVYQSELYHALRRQGDDPGHMRDADTRRLPMSRREILEQGHILTNYMENHDELRLAHRFFFPGLSHHLNRGQVGLSYSTYSALMPTHYLIHGGQEVGEDGSVVGPFMGDYGRTSIFDYVYQPRILEWLQNHLNPNWSVLRERYAKVLQLKSQAPFNRHEPNSFADLSASIGDKSFSQWIGAYLRVSGDKKYLVVLNSDPFWSHLATLHFTTSNNQDPFDILRKLDISNDDQRYRFREIFHHPGWEPSDPNIDGPGIPGKVLYQAGNIPSGLYLGSLEPGALYIFEITPIED